MSLFAWLLLELLAGLIAGHLVNHRGEGMILDILLGILGAITKSSTTGNGSSPL